MAFLLKKKYVAMFARSDENGGETITVLISTLECRVR